MAEAKSGQEGPKNPTYLDMIVVAIQADHSRTGTSKQAILKYITEHYNLEPEKANIYVKAALKKGVETSKLKMAKESGKGANSYKLGDKPKREASTEMSAQPKPAAPKKTTAAKKVPVKTAKQASDKAVKPPAEKAPAPKPAEKSKSKAARSKAAAVVSADEEPPAELSTKPVAKSPAKKPKSAAAGKKKAAAAAPGSSDEEATSGVSKGKVARKTAKKKQPAVTDSGSAAED